MDLIGWFQPVIVAPVSLRNRLTVVGLVGGISRFRLVGGWALERGDLEITTTVFASYGQMGFHPLVWIWDDLHSSKAVFRSWRLRSD